MKLSPGKVSQPGAKQVYRGPGGDVLTLSGEPAPPGCEPLLAPVMRHGRRLTPAEPLTAARQRYADDLSWRHPHGSPSRLRTSSPPDGSRH